MTEKELIDTIQEMAREREILLSALKEIRIHADGKLCSHGVDVYSLAKEALQSVGELGREK